MSEPLPYLAAPGSIIKCLEKISNAATPEKVTGDFVKTKLAIKGGTGGALPAFLKKIGFVNSDGTPTDIYIQFRNPAEAGYAVARAIKIGYKPLYESNEYAHELNDTALKGLIVQVTGQEAKSIIVTYTLRTFKNLIKLADFDITTSDSTSVENDDKDVKAITPIRTQTNNEPKPSTRKLGMNLSYTINLNLPATSDISVFNAIFKSLKENLLDVDET